MLTGVHGCTVSGTSPENTELSPKWSQERTPPPRAIQTREKIASVSTDKRPQVHWPAIGFMAYKFQCALGIAKKDGNRLFKGTEALIRRCSEPRQTSLTLAQLRSLLRNGLGSNWAIPSSTSRWQPGLESHFPPWLRAIPFNPNFLYHGKGCADLFKGGQLLGSWAYPLFHINSLIY